MVLFESLGMVSYSHSISIALYCIISEIKRDIGRKSLFFHTPPLHSTPSLGGGGPRDNIAIGLLFGVKKPEWYSCPTVKKSLRIRLAFRQNTG